MNLAAATAIVTLVLMGCSSSTATQTETLVLATTTSTSDSGLIDPLVAAFEASDPRFRVKVVAAGSGEAIALGRNRDADVLIVHSPADEEQLVAEGRVASRRALMHNGFVLAGPPSDPAAVAASSGISEAFRRIAAKGATFVSRGDRSGTHAKELQVWREAGVSPAGSWYVESGQGQGETLVLASEKQAYTLTDSATMAATGSVDLSLLYTSPADVNRYHSIVMKDARHPRAARAFARWLHGEQARGIIAGFGERRYGRMLFTPEA